MRSNGYEYFPCFTSALGSLNFLAALEGEARVGGIDHRQKFSGDRHEILRGCIVGVVASSSSLRLISSSIHVRLPVNAQHGVAIGIPGVLVLSFEDFHVPGGPGRIQRFLRLHGLEHGGGGSSQPHVFAERNEGSNGNGVVRVAIAIIVVASKNPTESQVATSQGRIRRRTTVVCYCR